VAAKGRNLLRHSPLGVIKAAFASVAAQRAPPKGRRCRKRCQSGCDAYHEAPYDMQEPERAQHGRQCCLRNPHALMDRAEQLSAPLPLLMVRATKLSSDSSSMLSPMHRRHCGIGKPVHICGKQADLPATAELIGGEGCGNVVRLKICGDPAPALLTTQTLDWALQATRFLEHCTIAPADSRSRV